MSKCASYGTIFNASFVSERHKSSGGRFIINSSGGFPLTTSTIGSTSHAQKKDFNPLSPTFSRSRLTLTLWSTSRRPTCWPEPDSVTSTAVSSSTVPNRWGTKLMVVGFFFLFKLQNWGISFSYFSFKLLSPFARYRLYLLQYLTSLAFSHCYGCYMTNVLNWIEYNILSHIQFTFSHIFGWEKSSERRITLHSMKKW